MAARKRPRCSELPLERVINKKAPRVKPTTWIGPYDEMETSANLERIVQVRLTFWAMEKHRTMLAKQRMPTHSTYDGQLHQAFLVLLVRAGVYA